MIRWVPFPAIRPQRCAVYQHIGEHQEGFIDAGTELDDSHVYISVRALRDMAEAIGYVPAHDVTAAARAVELAAARISALEAQLAVSEERFAAIDTLESEGYRARKKPGRPVKNKEEVAA